MAHIDLYSAFQLDRRGTSIDLTRQLTEKLVRIDPQQAQLCAEIDTARRILGTPDLRAAYDAQLANPSAPTITSDVLRDMANVLPGSAAAVATGMTAGKGLMMALAAAAVMVLAIGAGAGIYVLSNSSEGSSGPAAAPSPQVEQLADEPAEPAPVPSEEQAPPPEEPAAPSLVGAQITSPGAPPSPRMPAGSDNYGGPFCNGAFSAGKNTSHDFAHNTTQAYLAAGGCAWSGSVVVYSPTTAQTYDMQCLGDKRVIRCEGGNNALVYIY